MSTPTPGPWKADGYHVRQMGQNGTRAIADVCYTGPHHTPPDEYPESCRLVDEANACLIAAAPELLEALICCLDQSWNGPLPDNWRGIGATAIAKATGKELA